MADIRELALLDGLHASARRASPWSRMATALRLAVRRTVVATSVAPFRALYAAVYRAHVRYALRILKTCPGTRAIYLARGLAADDVIHGVSDIDLAIFGDWSDEEHLRVLGAVRHLNRISPLYDTAIQVHQLNTLRNLYETDYSLQFRFDQGRRNWKLLWGGDILAALPGISPARVNGCRYMEARMWWDYFRRSAFGTGPLASDAIFRNSICFKAVSEILRLRQAIENGVEEPSRRRALESAASAAGPNRAFFERLLESRARRFLNCRGDVIEDTFAFLLPCFEEFQTQLAAAPPFSPFMKGLEIDAPAEEVFRAPEVVRHAQALVAYAKRTFSGYRAAYLLPSLSFLNMDDLLLMVDVDSRHLPTAAQVRELARLHRAGRFPGQRLALFLMVDNGAYQLDDASGIELWHFVLCPAAVPDVFALRGGRDFLLDGEPRPAARSCWSRFAGDLVDEELAVRRAAMSKFAALGEPPPPLVIQRNLWRYLQLEVVQRSCGEGRPLVPLTPGAVRRALAAWGMDAGLLGNLLRAYTDELAGRPSETPALIDAAVPLFTAFSGAR